MNSRLFLFSLISAALLAGSGCVSPPPPEPAANAGTPSSSGNFEYSWSDPFFYEPWYNPDALVLPPPPLGALKSGVRASPASTDSAGIKELEYR